MRSFHRCVLVASFTLASSFAIAVAQTPTPTSPTRTVLASKSLPTVVDVPHYFVVHRLMVGMNAPVHVRGNGFLYVLSGTVTAANGEKRTTFREGDATSTEINDETTLSTKGSDGVLLHFILSRQDDGFLSTPSPHARELYRTASPLPGLKAGLHEFTFVRVSFPPRLAPNRPHYRSGAAVYYVLAGTGLFISGDKQEEKLSGSIQYEPNDLIHQWGNPGDTPLIFLQANINQEGVPAVIFK